MTYGYYQQPYGGEPGGYYMFNAFKPEERSILMAEATIYHELVPATISRSRCSARTSR